jgi:hypothetical protein
LSHELLSEAVKSWTNIREQRPFKSLSTNPIIVGTLEGLSYALPDLEIATIGLDELSRRRKPNAKNGIKVIESKLLEIGHNTIPWLFKVRHNLQYLQKEHPPKKTYKTTLYVILRDGYTEHSGRYGLYIGETSKATEERFREHKEGTRSARGLEEHGIQLLYSLMWPWQKVPQGNHYNLYYESALHFALKINNQNGPKTSGNVEELEEWPEDFQDALKRAINANS